MNDCKFIGNLGKDPELKATAAGKSYAKFSIAVNKYWYDSENQKQEKTTWVNVTVWGKLAEVVAKSLQKGTRAFVAGELVTNQYVDKDGIERTGTELNASVVYALAGRSEDAGAPQDSNSQHTE
jgi:single-strand DNA-binding protein